MLTIGNIANRSEVDVKGALWKATKGPLIALCEALLEQFYWRSSSFRLKVL